MTTGTLPDWCRQEWERLCSLPHNDNWMRCVFSSKCHPLQRYKEWRQMVQTSDLHKPSVVCEIGASRGGGLAGWAHTLPTISRIASYEINGFPYADLFAERFPRVDWNLVHGSSIELNNINHTKRWLNGDRIDALFVDGQKTGGAFTKDFHNHLPLMAPNGIVFMHDIQSTAAKDWRAIEESSLYRTARIIDTSESLAAIQRDISGVQPHTDYEKWLRHWKGRSAGVGAVFLGT